MITALTHTNLYLMSYQLDMFVSGTDTTAHDNLFTFNSTTLVISEFTYPAATLQ